MNGILNFKKITIYNGIRSNDIYKSKYEDQHLYAETTNDNEKNQRFK